MSKMREFLRDNQKIAVASLAVAALSALVALAAFGQDYVNGKESSSMGAESPAAPTSSVPNLIPSPTVTLLEEGSTSTPPSGESPSAPPIELPPSASRPLIVDLTSLDPAALHAVHRVEPATMGGVEYPEALKIKCSTYDEVSMEYTLGKQYSSLSGWIGIQDDASNSYAAANIKLTDENERVLTRVSGPYASPKKINNVDLRNVMRLRIYCRLSDSRKFSSQHYVTLAGMQLKTAS